MKIFFTSIIILLCFSSCKSKEEKHNEKIQEIENVIKTYGGNIIGKTTRWAVSSEPETRIVYTSGDTLFCWNIRSDVPDTLFINPEQLQVYEYAIDFTPEGAIITHTKKPITKVKAPSFDGENEVIVEASDVFKSVDIDNRYHMAGEWIFIGGDFVASLSDPNKLIDISNLGISDIEKRFDTKLPQTRKEFSDVWTGYVECESNNNVLKISLYGENDQLPGFLAYSSNISDYEWRCGGRIWSEERNETDYHFKVDLVIEGTPDEVKVDRVVWRQKVLDPEEMTVTGLQKVYKQREEEVLQQIEEDIENEKQEKFQLVKEQSVSFSELVEAYYGNTAYGSQKYPTGRNYILKVEFEQILSSNFPRYKYRFKDHISILERGYFYSNNDSFASLQFPFTGYVSCYFNSYNKEYVMFSDEVYEITFYFTDTEPILWYE